MAHKHQTKSYRTINGERWMNYADTWDGTGYDCTDTAIVIAALKAEGKEYKKIKYDGINRIFVKP